MTTELFLAAIADRYRIEDRLGQGGMATVYLARDLKHDRDVALKVLRPELGAVLGTERFLAEIRITARLDHPRILTLIDSGAAEGFLYYVLPVVRGESLRAKLDREKQLGTDGALAIATQVAGALDYAHRQGVVHRDIKPENILLHEGEAVLTDFGIALAVREAGGSRLTETGLSLGTPQYMSPEQASGGPTIDARSDIYSLGAVLYEMLAGEPPVTGPNAQAMIAKLMTERPVRLAVVRSSVPSAIDAAVARALEKVPVDRFATAAEFARALAGSSAVPSAPRRPRLQVLAMTGVALAVIALGAAGWRSLRAKPAVTSVFAPQLEQLTTDGNAGSPALSPDGTRLAYVATECDERQRCSDKLIVSDIGGAGSMTALEGGSLTSPAWAANGRFLVVARITGGRRRATFTVPAVGGVARPLPGASFSVIGASDTILTGPRTIAPSDTAVWFRLVTVGDAVVRDSVRVRQPERTVAAYAAPTGGRIALVGYRLRGMSLRLIDRSGRVTDSLPVSTRTYRSIQWTASADALVLQVDLGDSYSIFSTHGVAPVPSAVIRRRVSPEGRFVGAVDTLMKLERGSQLAMLRPDGSVLLAQGSIVAEVYALERPTIGRLEFRTRRVTTSTAGLRALLSRDGRTVWLRYGATGPTTERRNSFLPFEGGAERSFVLPAGTEFSTDWSRPVSDELLYASRDSTGRARLAQVEVATGLTRRVTELPAPTSFVNSIPGGGYGAGEIETHSMRVHSRRGRADTVWTVPDVPRRLLTVPAGATSDGRAFLEFSQTSEGDSVFVRRVPIDGGVPSPPFVMIFPQWFGSLPDGSYETMEIDSTGVVGWYRIPPGGTQRVRLGDAPMQAAGIEWDGSEDGRRLIAVKPVSRPDVFVIRNFGELLRR